MSEGPTKFTSTDVALALGILALASGRVVPADSEIAHTINIGQAVESLAISGDLVAFVTSEESQGGTDLNGDGDARDRVVQVFNVTTGTLVNTRQAVASGPINLAMDGHLVAFPTSEQDQDGTDLDGDGDSNDAVLHVFDTLSGTLINSGQKIDPRLLLMKGNLVAFLAPERGFPGPLAIDADLNGDGDLNDEVVHVFDVASRTVMNTGQCGHGGVKSLAVGGNWVAFVTPEARQGETDLNGDGDVEDFVVQVFDVMSRVTINLGQSVHPSPPAVAIGGNTVAFITSEFSQGRTDLNRDGDAGDTILQVFDVDSRTITNTGLDADHNAFGMDENLVGFLVWEAGRGDLNGDGDTGERVVHVFDVASGRVTNTGQAGLINPGQSSALGEGTLVVKRDLVSFITDEFWQGVTDLNEDGDTRDRVVQVFDMSSRTVINTRQAVSDHSILALGDGLVAFGTLESEQGQGDLNGDGDLGDGVAHVFDVNSGVLYNTGVAGRFDPNFELVADGDLIAFQAYESFQGQTDLNGDGDFLDRVVFAARIGGRQVPGDCNQDGVLDVSDAICLLEILFLDGRSFPCDRGSMTDSGNLALIDWQPDGVIGISDGVASLNFLFLGGPPHDLAIRKGESLPCARIVGCPDMSGCK